MQRFTIAILTAAVLLLVVRSVNLQRRLARAEQISAAAASVATDTRHDCLNLKTTPPIRAKRK